MDENWDESILDGPSTHADEQSLDEILSLLSHQYVRYTLIYLSDHPTTTLDQLADVLTGLEAMETGTIAQTTDRERIRLRLYHSDLPRLDAAGYIDFDTETQTVTTVSIPPVVQSLLGIDT